MDSDGHGTQVAALIAGLRNGIGTVGLMYSGVSCRVGLQCEGQVGCRLRRHSPLSLPPVQPPAATYTAG